MTAPSRRGSDGAESFRVFADRARTEFIDNERIPFADLRVDVKAQLLEFLTHKKRMDLRLAS